MRNCFRTTIVLFAVLFTAQSFAAFSPVSLGVVPPAQFPPRDFSITGARVSALWGVQQEVYGLDVGLLGNITEQKFVGLAVSGLFNKTSGTTTILGLQFALGANINTNKTNVVGFQIAGLNYNSAESAINGLQLGLANLSNHTSIRGFQAGIYNKAKEVYGFQIGLINSAANLHGIQIGLLNFHDQGIFKVSPIINIGF